MDATHPTVSRAELLSLGISSDAIGGRLSRGTLRRVARGHYLAPDHLEQLRQSDDATAATVLLHVAQSRLGGQIVATGRTAALLHGLPLLGGTPFFTAARRRGRPRLVRSEVGVLRVSSRDSDLEPVEVGSVRTTPVARLVLDVACGEGLAAALMVADAALHRGLVTPAELADCVRANHCLPGIRQAVKVAGLADGRIESPIESLARAVMESGGLPTFEPQQWILDGNGDAVARVDFCYGRVIVEADGMLKYADPEALRAEKRREDRLRELGYEVVRVTWDELLHEPARVIARIRRAMARAAARYA